ncbi:type IV secretory system conjugative DNA transfer family protein [uncultured Salinibacterium sp.]|uniref:type IV secretory system conjugative DNA transfer family protein n=1 Tax=uncultured Salinibacterium sp. TaxID=459274 RepID=UPI0030D9FE0D|tara:strand:+ start:128188 stop:130311 length:2124 start_codon:yes stop_codon:yes gene_type:complete
MSESLVFTRLHLPRPLTPNTLRQLLERMMSGDVPRPLILEVHATSAGVTHLLGCAPTAVQRLKRLLSGSLPGVGFEATTRPDVAAVSRVVAHPTSLPLANVEAEEISAAIYQALAARRGDEQVALQIIVGRSHAPRSLPPNAPDPLQPFGSRLLDGVRPASGTTKTQLSQRMSVPTLATTLRIAVTAKTKKRHSALTWEVFGALQLLESPGVHFTLNRDTPFRWATASVGRGLRLSASELLPLLGWPLGDRDYPGIPGAHPRLLQVPEVVSRTESVFATGTAPGPKRPVGIDPISRLQHAVVLGPTGSGKSTLLEHLILSDIKAGRACCVIEPKSQLIERILATAPKETAERIVVLDATDTEAPVGFNPLDVGDRDPDIVVDGILAALAAVFNDSWGPRTEYLIQGALLSLARAGQKRAEPYTLIDLPRLFTDDAFRRPIVAAVQDDITLAAFWEEFEAMRPAQRAAVIASPLNKLRKIVMRKPLVAVLGQSKPRFRLRDIFRDRMVVLVPLNDALLGTGASRLLGSLVVAELWMATLERAQEKSPMKRPGMVFIDEVQNYLHLPTPIDDVLATSRSYGVAWHLAHQYRDQLPSKMRTALDVNARTKICFGLDPDDARDMARQAPLLTADDFQALDQHHIYTRLVAGGTPMPWCSALALPPLIETSHGREIREASRRRYGADPPEAAPVAEKKIAASASTHQKARRT